MKKWIIAAILILIGVTILCITAKFNGDLDAYHLSQPGPHGQFTGSNKDFLIGFFVMFLIGVVILSTVVTSILAFLKWKRITLKNTTTPKLLYWSFLTPIVVYTLIFSSWTLWLTVGDYSKYLK